MKKLLLIPLMTLVCSVMAWGENVAIAQIGETTYYKGDEADAENHIYTTAQLALNATVADVENGGTIKLLSGLTAEYFNLTAADPQKTITIDLNGKTLTRNNAIITVNSGNKLILVNTDSNNNGCINHTGTSNINFPIWCKTGAEVEINAGVIVQAAKANSIKGGDGATITINGGIIRRTPESTNTAPAIICGTSAGVGATLTINGGTVESIKPVNSEVEINDGAVVGKITAQYASTVIINEGATVSNSEGAAIEAEAVGEAIPTITINGGYITYTGSGTPDLVKCNGAILTMNGGTINNTAKWDAIYAYNGAQITINGGLVINSCTNASKNSTYAIHVNGNTSGSGDSIKTTLNFNGGTITCNSAPLGYGITVQGKGATLNMTGGTINANHMAITGNGTAAYSGTTINISGGTIGNETTEIGIYHPQEGRLNISGGTITGTTGIGIKGGKMKITGGTIHATGDNGGRVDGYNSGMHPSFAAIQIESNRGYDIGGMMDITVSDEATLISDSWYAFYEYLATVNNVATTETKVGNIAVTGGNFQGGILISQDLATKGGFVSAGKWSKDITANVVKGKVANPIDEDPYFFEVGDPTAATAEIVNDPSKNAVLTNEDGETYASTYTSEAVGDDAEVKTTTATNQVVVSENTDVVVDDTDENNSTIVEVKKVTVEGDAELNIKEGATLIVGSGSVLLDESTTTGGLTVEAGAALVVDGLVYGATEDNFVIEGQEDKSGIVLFSPETEFIKEDHPTATYRFTSKSFRDGDKWVYQRFGMPSFDGNVTVKSGNLEKNSYICTWDYAADDWGAWSPKIPAAGLVYTDAVPFQCYQLGSTNAKDAPITYDFIVELMGNANYPLNFKAGWNPYANSYTAPIDIKEFLTDVIANTSADIQATIYLYKDLGNDTYTWQGINLGNVGKTYRVRENGAMVKKTYDASIEPMQAFIMKLASGDDATTDINYLNNVYNPAMGIDRPAAAPARNHTSYNEMQIGVFNDMYWDNISVMEGEQFSADLDNGYDACKYDHNRGLSLYVINGATRMERIAIDNAEGLMVGIDAPVAGQYTLDFSNVNGEEFAIIDMTNNAVINVVEDGEYTFYAEAGANDYRFQIVKANKMPTAIDNVEATAAIKGIYTITGQFVGFDFNRVPAGVYVVNGVKVVK